jgi:cytochrome c-type biogenesis protein CcmH
MRAWLPAAALGGLLAVAALVAMLALQPRPEPTAAERVDEISRGLRCPDCQGLSVADSPTASAQEIRRQIAGLVADGATDDEVRDHFVARYGQWILLAPSSPVVWIIPFAVVLAGAAALGRWLLARRRRALVPAPVASLTTDERRRLHEEAEALDA